MALNLLVGNSFGDALRPATQSIAKGIPNEAVGNEFKIDFKVCLINPALDVQDNI